jgi:hypothetical protein
VRLSVQRPPEWLIGKPVSILEGPPGLRSQRYGIVRNIYATKKDGLRTVTVQLPGGAGLVGGKTYSARCGGDTVKCVRESKFVTVGPKKTRAVWDAKGCGVKWRGEIVPILEIVS